MRNARRIRMWGAPAGNEPDRSTATAVHGITRRVRPDRRMRVPDRSHPRRHHRRDRAADRSRHRRRDRVRALEADRRRIHRRPPRTTWLRHQARGPEVLLRGLCPPPGQNSPAWADAKARRVRCGVAVRRIARRRCLRLDRGFGCPRGPTPRGQGVPGPHLGDHRLGRPSDHHVDDQRQPHRDAPFPSRARNGSRVRPAGALRSVADSPVQPDQRL